MNARYPESIPTTAKFVSGALPAALLLAAGIAVAAPGPSYSCRQVRAGSIEALICNDARLSALDRKLAAAYMAASAKLGKEPAGELRRSQRDWLRVRDECRHNDDRRGCVQNEYQHRIAELLVKYRLVQGAGPFTFVCDGAPEVVATFFQTDPPTVIAQRSGNVSSLMYLQPGHSGARYQGGNEMFWQQQDEALVRWGPSVSARCREKS